MKNVCFFKSNQALILLCLIMLFSSCSKLPIYKSEEVKSNTESKFGNLETNHFDKDNDVHYGIAHNDTSLYIKATFHDQQSLMKIMRGGLHLYFDPNGKKGKSYKLVIERAEQELVDRSTLSPQNMNSPENRMKNMPIIINAILTKVTWDANGKELIFYRGLQKHTIGVELLPNQFNELQVMVQMPLSELPIPENNLMSMGICTGSVSSSSGNRTGAGMRPSGGMGGGRGGGQSGGGSGMGGGGGRPGGGNPGGAPGGGSSANMSPIQIWFQVEL